VILESAPSTSPSSLSSSSSTSDPSDPSDPSDLSDTHPTPLPDSLTSQALASDPAYAKAKAERQAAEASLQLEYRRILPLSDASASAERKRAPDGKSWALSFDSPIPLFNWNQGGIEKARAELLTALAEEEKARREVMAHLSEAWEDWRTARWRHEAYSMQIATQRAQLAADAQELFAAGEIGYTELLQARREWREAELAAVDSWRDSQIASWKILCQLGQNDPANSPANSTAPIAKH